MNFKRLLYVLVLFLLAFSAASAQGPEGGPGNRQGGGPGGNRGGGGGGTDKSSDAELQVMIADVAPKFELLTWEEPETGISLQYQQIVKLGMQVFHYIYEGGSFYE